MSERGVTAAERTVAVLCGDWPIVAVGGTGREPIVVMDGQRVGAVSSAARDAGIEAGMRRRQAQSCCPDVRVASRDRDAEVRRFDGVVSALDDVAARIDIVEPGLCVLPMAGPRRLFGGEDGVVAAVHDVVGRHVAGSTAVSVGVADGGFAAHLAACVAGERQVMCEAVPPGESRAFLSAQPVSSLAASELVGVFVRLGLYTLGDLAALDRRDVLGRFGSDGAVAWDLASGRDLFAGRRAGGDDALDVIAEFDPPLDRVEAAAFAAKSLAEELGTVLASRGSSCARVIVVAETSTGQRLERSWRHEGMLTSSAIAQRVRWQLDAWLVGGASRGAIERLVLIPDGVRPAGGRQMAFWGGLADTDRHAAEGLVRLQGVVGRGGVLSVHRRGGRGPGEQFASVPFDGSLAEMSSTFGVSSSTVEEPWPGQVPSPLPTHVYPDLLEADVVDGHGRTVSISGRGLVSAEPARLRLEGGPWLEITGWAGPWLAEERWWDGVAHRRRARFQMIDERGAARLMTVEDGRWWVEAVYD